MNTTALGNRISFEISDDDLKAVQGALQVLQQKLVPLLVSLGTEDRRALPKMGAKTVDFVSKTLSYARANPQYQPTFVDLDEYAIDLAAVGTLREIQQPLSMIADMVNDTLLLSGSEAYAVALVCYQAFKSAAKVNAPGASTIANDLSDRFPSRSSRSSNKAPGGDAPSKPTDPAL